MIPPTALNLSADFSRYSRLSFGWATYERGRLRARAQGRPPELPDYQPYRSIILHKELPSFSDRQPSAARHLTSAILLANYQAISVNSPEALEGAMNNDTVVAVLGDVKSRDYLWRVTQKKGHALFLARPSGSFGSQRVGHETTLQIGDRMETLANIYKTARPLAHAQGPDVVRSVGFHGTWVTTYGLMAIREDFQGKVAGRYWYGYGEITGETKVDPLHGAVQLEFEWSQDRNKGLDQEIGSSSRGNGIFFLAAGYETFFGYWYVEGQEQARQPWSGTRLSRDIVINIKEGRRYSEDFGLWQHPASAIVDPGPSEG